MRNPSSDRGGRTASVRRSGPEAVVRVLHRARADAGDIGPVERIAAEEIIEARHDRIAVGWLSVRPHLGMRVDIAG